MIDLLHFMKIHYVVLGNHEFDFGANYLRSLLSEMKFKVFGSNLRTTTADLCPGITDYDVLELPTDLKVGFFGVLTSTSGDIVYPNASLQCESEVIHAQRCVNSLQAAQVDIIVALTHTRAVKDRLIARQVSGIHLILGGHDHEPFTCFEQETLIHKSGCDAKWLARIDLSVVKMESTLQVHF